MPTTISFGIATYPHHGQTAASLLRAADDALYAAKESGRNRTVLHSPGLGERPRAQILEHSSLTDIRGWVCAHHERPDGRGYPLGLTSESIALEAQIIAVADAYEAMTSDRAYRPSIGHDNARAELQSHAGTQFEPHVVNAFLDVLERESTRAETALHPQLA